MMGHVALLYAGGFVAVTLMELVAHESTPVKAVIAGAAWPVWAVWGLIERVRS